MWLFCQDQSKNIFLKTVLIVSKSHTFTATWVSEGCSMANFVLLSEIPSYPTPGRQTLYRSQSQLIKREIPMSK